MSQTVISINAGSSSLKVTLFRTAEGSDNATKKIQAIGSANVAGIGGGTAKLTYSRGDHKKQSSDKNSTTHDEAFRQILETFVADEELKDVARKEDIGVACHRVVHGGDYTKNVLITDETYHHIENLEDLAPLSVYIPTQDLVQYILTRKQKLADTTHPPSPS